MNRVSVFGAVVVLPLAFLRAETALDAVKLLPKDQAGRIARIEGREGTPEPDRWYILTQDPAAENGLHEFVVAGGSIVASRQLSQFSDGLKPDDILGVPINVDSDKAGKLAHDYAAANGMEIASINYELKKEGPGGAPAWTLSCVDPQGNQMGALVLTAAKGEVITHEGFSIVPPPALAAERTASAEGTPHRKPHPPSQTKVTTNAGTPSKKPASPVAQTLNKVGRTLQKFLPF